MTNDQPISGAEGRDTPAKGAAWSLSLLLGINLFNYIDRQVLAAVEPDVRRALLSPLDPNPRGKMGWLSTAFIVTYMLVAPLFGWLAERMSRWWLVAIGVAIWSVASGASGWAGTFTLLLITRCFVGVGEAAYGPVAPTIIADLYPIRQRGLVLSFFYLAIPVGGALGYALGGQVAESSLGWRWAFYLVLPPGLLLAGLCLFMRDVRSKPDAAVPRRKPGIGQYAVLLRTPSYVLDCAGMAAMTFAIGGIGYFMPDYLELRHVAGLGKISPRLLFGVITAVGGLLATIAGGLAGDALRKRFPGSYFLVSAGGLLAGAPLLALMLFTPFPFAWIWLFLCVFCLFFNTGPSNTILANVTHPAIRASAFAINILVIHALGDAISPPVIGHISDWLHRAGHTEVWSMNAAFMLISSTMVIGGLFWFWGARYLEKDTAAAPTRLGE